MPAASTSGGALQGSLYGPSDAQMGQWREFLATRKSKDAALFLRKWMREALRKAGIQTKMRFKAGAALLPLTQVSCLHTIHPQLKGRMWDKEEQEQGLFLLEGAWAPLLL